MSGIGKTLGGLLGVDSPAPPAPPPPTPTLSDPAIQTVAEEERRKRAAGGRASTIVSGLTEEDAPGAKLLLGAGI